MATWKRILLEGSDLTTGDIAGQAITGTTGSFSSTVSWSGGSSGNANTAYTYSQVGHLPLAGGTLTGNLIRGKITIDTDHVLFSRNGSYAASRAWRWRVDDSAWGNFDLKRSNGEDNTIDTLVLSFNNSGNATFSGTATFSSSPLLLSASSPRLSISRTSTSGNADLSFRTNNSETDGCWTIRMGSDTTPDLSFNRWTEGSADTAIMTLNHDGSSTFSGNLTVGGDLIISGSTTTVNTATITVEDPLIKLASGNSSADTVDIGFYGLCDPSGSQDTYTGLIRDASDGKYHLFDLLQAEPTTTMNIGHASFDHADLTVGALTVDDTFGVTGEVTLSSHLNMGDSDIIKLGASQDLQIYHDGSHSYIKDTGTGHLRLATDEFRVSNAAVNETIIDASQDGGVGLYHNDSKKLDTTSSGISVTGTVDATNYKIGGAQGSDGQVLTSTGSGVAWEAAGGGLWQRSSTTLSPGNAGDSISVAAGTFTGNVTVGSGSVDQYIDLKKGNSDKHGIIRFYRESALEWGIGHSSGESGDAYEIGGGQNFGIWYGSSPAYAMYFDTSKNATFAGTVTSNLGTSTSGIFNATGNGTGFVASTHNATGIFGHFRGERAGTVQYYLGLNASDNFAILNKNASVAVSIDTDGNTGNATFASSVTTGDDIFLTKNADETLEFRITNDDTITSIGSSIDGYSYISYENNLNFSHWDGSTWSGSKMVLDSSGNTTLAGKLILSGNPNIVTGTSDGSDNGALEICGGGAASPARGAYLLLRGNQSSNGSISMEAGYESGVSSGNINFKTNNVDRFTIENDGKVYYNNPGGEAFMWRYQTDSNYQLQLNQTVTSGLVKHNFNVRNAGTWYDYNLVLDRGNVGIGVADPDTALEIAGAHISAKGLLHIDSTDHAYMALDAHSASHDSGIYFSENGTQQHLIGYDASENYFVHKDGSNNVLMVIQSDGNVGIGTASPDGVFHVESSDMVAYFNATETYSAGVSGPKLLGQGKDSGGTERNLGYILFTSQGSNQGEMRFAVRNSSGTVEDKMIIDDAGNVGIGGAPTDELTIHSSSGSNKFHISADGSNWNLRKQASGGSSNDVMYGTWSSTDVTFAGLVSSVGGFKYDDSTYNLGLYGNVTGGKGGLYSTSNNSMGFWTNSTLALTLDTSQNATFAGTITQSKDSTGGVVNTFRNTNAGTSAYVELHITNSDQSLVVGYSDNHSSGQWDGGWVYPTAGNMMLKSNADVEIFAGGKDDSDRKIIIDTNTSNFYNRISFAGNGTAADNSLYKASNDYIYLTGGTAGLALKGKNSDDSTIYLVNSDQKITFNTNNTTRLTINNNGTTFNKNVLWLLGTSYNAKIGMDGQDGLNIDVGNNATELTLELDQSNNVKAPNGHIQVVSDSKKFTAGVGGDIQMYHNGNNSFIANSTGGLYIDNLTNNGYTYLRTNNSGGSTTTVLALHSTLFECEVPVQFHDDLTVLGDYFTINNNAQNGIKIYGNDTACLYIYDKADGSLSGGLTWSHDTAEFLVYTNGVSSNSEALKIASDNSATFAGNVNMARAAGMDLSVTSTSGRALLFLQAANATGDPYVCMETNSSTWSAGLDNSDNDSYKIANGSHPGTGVKFMVESAQTLSLQNFKIYNSSSNSNPQFAIQNDARIWEFFVYGGGSDQLVIKDGTADLHRLKINSDGHVLIGQNPWTIINGGNSNTVPWLASLNNENYGSATYGWSWFNRSTEGDLRLTRNNNSTTEYDVLNFARSSGNATFWGKVGIDTAPDSDYSLKTNAKIYVGATGSYFNGTITVNSQGNSSNWYEAYQKRQQWNGDSTNLNADTARNSLALNIYNGVRFARVSLGTADDASYVIKASGAEYHTGGNVYFNSGNGLLVNANNDGNWRKVVVAGDASDCATHNGAIATDNWFRNYGDGGIYFNSHGGGWHMTDSDWIRAYNNKQVYAQNNIQTGSAFQVGGSDKEIQAVGTAMYFTTNGNYEMSTSRSDAGKHLLLNHGSSGIGNFTYSNLVLDTDSGSTAIHMKCTGTGTNAGYLMFGTSSSQTDGYVKHNGDGHMVLRANSNSNQLILDTDGSVDGNLNDTSDVALKTNIVSLSSGLDYIKQLRPVNFDWREFANGSGKAAGFIAQEVELVTPENVKGTNYFPTVNPDTENEIAGSWGKSINVTGIVAYLTKAVQELSVKNDALEAEVEALKNA